MLQQKIALIIILFIILKLFWQKRKNNINKTEFIFWIVFWLLSGTAILYIKKLDKITADLGFSASGIDILLYLSIVILFYSIFKLHIIIAKQEKIITKIIREITINKKK